MLQCPKCHAAMRTYNRSGVHIEQCEGCRGIFLDYGELEALSRLESQWGQPPPAPGVPMAAPPAPGVPGAPAWGAPQPAYGYGHKPHKRHKSLAHMLFSS